MVATNPHYTASHAVTRPRSAPNPVRFMFAAAAVYRQRRVLSRLDEAALRDLGLTRAEAEAEASRPFWDVPSDWFR